MFFEQLVALCNADNTTPTKFVTDVLHLSSSKVTAWKNGSIPKYEILNLIANYFNVSIGSLFDGKEKSSPTVELTTDERELLDNFKKLSYNNRIRVKERAEVLAELEAPAVRPDVEELQEIETIFIEYSVCRVSAGTGEPLIDDSQPEFIEVQCNKLTEKANFAVKINGNSMLPRFKDKDIVLVRSQPTVEIGEIGIFIIDGDGYIKERGKNCLISLNPDYDNIYICENQDIRCKGLVLGTLENDDII